MTNFPSSGEAAMSGHTVPFNQHLFEKALIGLFGRKPDFNISLDSAHYIYQPKNDEEKEKFQKEIKTICWWAENFDLVPMCSFCVYGTVFVPKTISSRMPTEPITGLHICIIPTKQTKQKNSD